jgi:hypothetical protein
MSGHEVEDAIVRFRLNLDGILKGRLRRLARWRIRNPNVEIRDNIE